VGAHEIGVIIFSNHFIDRLACGRRSEVSAPTSDMKRRHRLGPAMADGFALLANAVIAES